jgi:putative tricarboxylic transport membrane protein
MIGSDSQTGSERFTFGHIHLYDGIDFLIAIVGLFAISEVLIFIEHHQGGAAAKSGAKIGRLLPDFGILKRSVGTMFRSTIIGFLSGVLPGAGASLGSFLSYSVEKNTVDREGKTFGKGDPRGIIAPEVGNNAAAGGALVPMLSLGVPGSGTTAVLLAVLLQLNITPGPLLFRNNPDIVWGLIAALFIANFMLLALNLPMVGLFTRVLLVPTRILMPVVAMISFVGIYGLTGSTFDVMLMVGFGFAGWALRKLGVPLVPVILGILLGNEMEVNMRRALQVSDGDWSIFVGSPLAIGIWAIAIIGFVLPIFFGKKVKTQMHAGHAEEDVEEVVKGGD